MDEFVPFEEEINTKLNDSTAPILLTNTPAPWLDHDAYNPLIPPMIRFHNEILSFCDFVAPSQQEREKRDKAFNDVSKCIKSLWPDVEIKVFGSEMTKIITPTSDIDISVLGVQQEKDDNPTYLLLELVEKIKESGIASYVEAVTNAKFPIVKLDHLESKIAMDICINSDSGLKTGAMITKFLKEYPPLRPLTIVLKIFLVSLKFLFYFYC
jgi:non-canonical poly(A) RNA polymerase PAPD5/7